MKKIVLLVTMTMILGLSLSFNTFAKEDAQQGKLLVTSDKTDNIYNLTPNKASPQSIWSEITYKVTTNGTHMLYLYEVKKDGEV